MVHNNWNFDLNRWQHIGQPLRANRGANAGSDLAAVQRIKDVITGSCLGFGPMMAVATGSNAAKDFVFYPKELLSNYFKPVSSFGFPVDAKYRATGSQYILAKDIGITKPMLVEKLSWAFDADFEIPSGST